MTNKFKCSELILELHFPIQTGQFNTPYGTGKGISAQFWSELGIFGIF